MVEQAIKEYRVILEVIQDSQVQLVLLGQQAQLALLVQMVGQVKKVHQVTLVLI
jgi:hypothetical protein